VIVGSGYGGAVAASRLARTQWKNGRKPTVCVLERGRELQPGDYPDTPTTVFAETQVDTPAHHFRSRTALYDFRLNKDINVLVGCGLGGTSLINANVALEPPDHLFQGSPWPTGLSNDMQRLKEGFGRAEQMLLPERYPYYYQPLRKLQALERAAEFLRSQNRPARFERPPIAVSFSDGLSPAGITQHACQLCGDCVSGCNYAAKNTLLMNYLPDAKQHGAEIFTEVSVRRLERRNDRWLVYYELLDTGRKRFGSPEMTVGANFVILAGGTLGSTEILLRSRDSLKKAGFELSNQLGRHFSANGGMLALGYNTDEPINGIGAGRFRPNPGEPAGPCITGMIATNDTVIEEGVIPGALASLLPAVLGGAALLFGGDTRARGRESLREEARRLLKYLRGPYGGAVRNTLTFLVVGRDSAGGRMVLDPVHDRLRIEWPGAEEEQISAEAKHLLREVTRELGGAYVKNPLNPITVHPLGGCRMAESGDSGVVDHECRVFVSGLDDPHLYVCDGSIIPRALGLNPLLTIAALADRMCARMAVRYSWSIDDS
jgi:cholesterol oxidase